MAMTQLSVNVGMLSGGKGSNWYRKTLYKQSKILILDESTSALDSTTEKNVIKSIKNLKEGRTVIMIAHRLSTLENCDLIVVERWLCI